MAEPESGAKDVRAQPLAAQCETRQRRMVVGDEEGERVFYSSTKVARSNAFSRRSLRRSAAPWASFLCSSALMNSSAPLRPVADLFVRARRVNVIVVYKVDRLTRSLADFAKLVELFDEHQVSFVSVTQSFNTTTSMGAWP